MKTLVWILIIVILGIGGVIIFRSKQDSNANQDQTTANNPEFTTVEQFNANQQLIIELAEIELTAQSGYEGSTGTATRRFSGSTFEHTIKAQLNDPPSGKFYEGWLVDGSNILSTGPLTKLDDLWELNFSAQANYPSYTQVVVTEETEANGLDGVPETHVLEGSFE